MNWSGIHGGAFPTMITPYDRNGNVDYGVVRALTEWYYEKGCDGIFAVCQSSEIFDLSVRDRAKITRTVLDTANACAQRKGGRRMTVVASGHVAYDREEQAAELCAVAAEGPDALILISNRMDIQNTTEEAWICDMERLMRMLPDDIPLGVYECPRPYKRLMTDKMLDFCGKSGRFAFMKDTCCDADIIDHRVKLLNGTNMLLLNANGQTLLESLRSGGAGYCGVMCNFHPELFVWLCHHYAEQPELADLVQSFIGCAAFTEIMAYPVTAKYHLKEIEKLPFESLTARTRDERELTDYQKSCVRQMDLLAQHMKQLLKGQGK